VEPIYIFLDPDGSRGVGLLVLIAAPTGVTYAHQCGGLETGVRELEGFAVPLGDEEAATPLVAFFKAFQGNPPSICSPFGNIWTETLIADLGRIVGAIGFWHTRRHPDDDRRLFLALDTERFAEATEAWVPVRTPYGPGVLIWDNSD
jgi:hypothetical protein